MNKLFGMDISKYGDGPTMVTFWRYHPTRGSGCYRRTFAVKSDATYTRLFNILPISNMSIHAQPDSLSIGIVGLDRREQK